MWFTPRWFKKRKSELLDVDEIFFDSFQVSQNTTRWEQRLLAPLPERPMYIVVSVVLVVLSFFTLKAGWMAVANGGELSATAEQNHIKQVWERSPRGIIYSQNFVPLVENTSSFSLIAVPAEIPKDHAAQEQIIRFLQDTFNKDRSSVVDLFKDIQRFSFKPIPLFNNLSQEEILAFRSQKEVLPGLRLEETFRRNYPLSPHTSHVLGYMGAVSKTELQNSNYLPTDFTGKTGIEAAYEDYLRGTYGLTEIEISSQGEEGRTLSQTPAEPGDNLVLFLNAALQQKVTEVTQRIFKEHGLSKGAVVALDPRSGGILALQSFPLYDANAFSSSLSPQEYSQLFENPARPLFNRALSGTFPPGSTIKPFMAIAALQEEVIEPEDTIFVSGSITAAGREFHDWQAHGTVDLRRALAVSSNVYFYTIGGGHGDIDGLGPYRINDYLKKFGLGDVTNIDLPAEQEGLIPNPQWKRDKKDEQWYIGDTYNTSIGQGDVLITPLNLAVSTAAIANGGTLLQPRVVKAIEDPQANTTQLTDISVIKDNLAPQHILQIVREGMRMGVTEGYMQTLQAVPVPVAGKTGTAQTSGDQPPHAWVATFAPYENPEIVVVVFAEFGGGGSAVATPIARDILQWYFSR